VTAAPGAGSNPVIRRIRANEGALLREIRLRALADAPDAFGSTFADTAARPPRTWAERAAANSEGKDSVMCVADTGQRWVGLAGGVREPDRPRIPEVVSMWVEPGWRRCGVAGRLLETVIEWASFGGATDIRLWVTEGNAPAIRLYERQGFLFTGEEAPLPSNPGLRELAMTRPVLALRT